MPRLFSAVTRELKGDMPVCRNKWNIVRPTPRRRSSGNITISTVLPRCAATRRNSSIMATVVGNAVEGWPCLAKSIQLAPCESVSRPNPKTWPMPTTCQSSTYKEKTRQLGHRRYQGEMPRIARPLRGGLMLAENPQMKVSVLEPALGRRSLVQIGVLMQTSIPPQHSKSNGTGSHCDASHLHKFRPQ